MNKYTKIKFIGIILVIVLLIAVSTCPRLMFVRDVTVTVSDKGTKRYRKNKGYVDKYLIYTIDDNEKVEVFEDTDSLIPWKFNSSDLYAIIEPGKKYKFTVRGLRLHLISEYANIYKVEKIEE
jgi:hypothetical protein